MMTMNAWSISAVSHTMPAEQCAVTQSRSSYQAGKMSINALDGALEGWDFGRPSVAIMVPMSVMNTQTIATAMAYRAENHGAKLHGLLNANAAPAASATSPSGVCTCAHHCGHGTRSSVSIKTDSIWTSPCFTGCDVRRRGGVGRRTHTGFVGVKAALDAPHHAGSLQSRRRLP